MGAKRERRRAYLSGAIGGLWLILGAQEAMAVSARLAASEHVQVPATTEAAEPTLRGLVIYDALLPFTMRDSAGRVWCEGVLENRVVRSYRTGRLDFVYRVRATGGYGSILGFNVSDLSGQDVRVAYRTDGVGTRRPMTARRYNYAVPWDARVAFSFADFPEAGWLDCGAQQESRMVVLRTSTTEFMVGGTTEIDGYAIETVRPALPIARARRLAEGDSIELAPTSAANEPSLAGRIVSDAMVPFSITNETGRIVCAGNLQNRVVQSNATGLLDFYYRLRDTRGEGAIAEISARGYSGRTIRVGYRADGSGTPAPTRASRSGPAGEAVTFRMTSHAFDCARAEESPFFVIKTRDTMHRDGGSTRIGSASGADTTVSTFRP